MQCVSMLNLRVIDSNRMCMNRTTQEMMNLINTLMTLNDNLPVIEQQFPDSAKDVDLMMTYVDYEIKKSLKDIIHNERL